MFEYDIMNYWSPNEQPVKDLEGLPTFDVLCAAFCNTA